MNIKAERIEQLIQLVNRNLLLIASRQLEGITPLDSKRLQKVDAVVFGQDKFAYELVHFVAHHSQKVATDRSLAAIWDENFVNGLEALLVECAVINDDVERDCFVSRIYCWFTEKLLERREVPRHAPVELAALKDSVLSLGIDKPHTVKGLEGYSPDGKKDPRAHLQEMYDNDDRPSSNPRADSLRLPAIPTPGHGGQSIAQRLPLYVRHAHPDVLQAAHDFRTNDFALPRAATAEAAKGVRGSATSTIMMGGEWAEGAENLQELWVARRRQEAFDYKTRQQLEVVLDHLALDKSRRESEALRRQESTNLLRDRQRPLSAPASPRNTTAHLHTSPPHSRPHTREGDGKSSIAARMARTGGADDRSAENSPGKANYTQGRGGRGARHGDQSQIPLTLTDLGDGRSGDREAVVPQASRSAVMRGSGGSLTGGGSGATGRKESFRPMRFKVPLPDAYAPSSPQHFLLSDSEEDEDAGVGVNGGGAAGGAAKPSKNKKKAAANPKDVNFVYLPPINRERPQSAKLLRTVVRDDRELKVLAKFSNFRRATFNSPSMTFLESREKSRGESRDALKRALMEGAAAKGDKKKGGKAPDAAKKPAGKKEGKGKSGGAEEATVKPKYKSASHFMSVHFPVLDDEDDGGEGAGMAPLRMMQLMEVGEVMDAFERRGLTVRESVLRKALVAPQDKPEAICLEGLREGAEGVMTNPMPPELWRKFVGGKGKKGKKKKGKK